MQEGGIYKGVVERALEAGEAETVEENKAAPLEGEIVALLENIVQF